jgi:hypothetical protein
MVQGRVITVNVQGQSMSEGYLRGTRGFIAESFLFM